MCAVVGKALVTLLVGALVAVGSTVHAGTTVDGTQEADGVNRPRQVTIISDSAMAGVRWNGALGGFRGFDAQPLLESCRRLVHASCRGREGYAPRTAYQEIARLPAAVDGEVLVIATGYNDWYVGYGTQARMVLDLARTKGYEIVAWVLFREQVGYTLPGQGLRSNYAAMNQQLRDIKASGGYPELRLWDLDHYTYWSPGWFHSDGVHETTLGSWGVADWISRHVAALDGRQCAEPWRPEWGRDLPCPNPDSLPGIVGLPDIPGIYWR